MFGGCKFGVPSIITIVHSANVTAAPLSKAELEVCTPICPLLCLGDRNQSDARVVITFMAERSQVAGISWNLA